MLFRSLRDIESNRYLARRFLVYIFYFIISLSPLVANAQPVQWDTGGWDTTYADTPDESCTKLWDQMVSPENIVSYTNKRLIRVDYRTFKCAATEHWSNGMIRDRTDYSTWRMDDSRCWFKEAQPDPETGGCLANGISPQQKGVVQEQVCPVSGDPINFINGNEFESEIDYAEQASLPLIFSRTYNSLDGLWRHNYSTHIRNSAPQIVVVTSDGREIPFTNTNGIITPPANESGKLIQLDNGWQYYDANNNIYNYDSSGALLSLSNLSGSIYTLTYSNNKITVHSATGGIITFSEDAYHQPLTLTTGSTIVAYAYNSEQHLIKSLKLSGTTQSTRQYLYEDTLSSRLLTGIIDELGVKYATWSYDAQGRAISSEHANSIGRVIITYNSDGTSTVTNELGKTTIYSFVSAGGLKRVSGVKGAPSANCLASNSTYIYDNNRGLVIQKTDAMGIVTQYTYNDRGLEAQRIEGVGSTQPRTTTTEWDPSRFLRTRIAGPTRITVYTYDAQGRPLTQITTPNTLQ